ncbi:tripartite tricarboxylate transporter substrate binding protein [Elioraea sp.]|uniref:Bug family tripartite tricarboxylate transporter substrate binding protein n=1 Tax=Elioraea sp. TaxID=2185103 RepID=UPI0025C33054|nr:tripartite tricarboxylate transporter substrate binding protein [Elioraea sp.]
MTLTRRATLAAAAGAAAFPFASGAQAAWPSRQIRLVVPFAPGGTTDLVARILANHLQEQLGQTVMVDNRPGAGAALGSQLVADAAPDGYTLVVSNAASHAVAPALSRHVRYDPVNGFSHIALIATTSLVAVVNPQWGVTSIADLIRAARAEPTGVDFAAAGVGTSGHLVGLRFAQRTGITLNHIPYRGSGPALNDLIAGNPKLMFDSLASSIGHIRSGTLRAIAVMDARRSTFLPDVASIAEQGFPDITSNSWFGISGPRGLPEPIVERLNREIRAALQNPDLRQRYRDLTAEIPDTTAAQYLAFVERERQVVADVVRSASISVPD